MGFTHIVRIFTYNVCYSSVNIENTGGRDLNPRLPEW